MGRRLQQFDTIGNVLSVALAGIALAAAILCVVKNTLHYAYLIGGCAALYYLIYALSAFLLGGEKAARKGIFRLVIALLCAAFCALAWFCLR